VQISATVTLAVLGAALLHASWNALLKSSADKSWPWLAASAAVHILYFAFLAKAYHWGDLSYAYPIMRGGGPVIVALAGAAIFGEVLPLAPAIGVALVCAGIIAFASGRAHPRATAFAIGNAVVIAAYTLIDAKGARASGSPIAYALWFFVANGIALYAWAGARRRAALPRHLASDWPRILTGAALTTGSYGVALWAMTRAPVALVAVLRETAVIFGAFIAHLWLKEKLTRRRLVATGAVMLGLVALKL
jgi:drug/metabolite transporter (DMT)-like permease